MTVAPVAVPPTEVSPFHSLSLVIAAFNEEEALPKLFDEVMIQLSSWPTIELIIVDDGSTDDTALVIDEISVEFEKEAPKTWSLQVISFRENRGMGAALKAGYHAASEKWVTFLPGDGQIEPKMISRLCELVSEGTCLVTTRYTNREYSFLRKCLSRGLRFISYAITWVDITSEGMYLVERKTLASMPLVSDSFMLNLEIPIRAAERRLKVHIAEIEVRPRQGGVSHATQWGRIMSTLIDLIVLKLQLLRERWCS